MLATRPKGKIVQRVVKNDAGKFVRAHFIVAEWEGRYFIRLIKTEALENNESQTNKNKNHFLLFWNEKSKPDFKKIIPLKSVFSPYFDLSYFVSQLARAPSKNAD